jgi:ATP-dependent HslUV protease subunit HslV
MTVALQRPAAAAAALLRQGPQGAAARFFSASSSTEMHGTTILCVRKDGKTALIGDGQVSQGSMVVKPNAKKVRRIGDDVLVGFAGSTADAFTLLERLEERLEEHPGQLTRACVDLAKAWRTDKYLRRLEAVLLVCDANVSFEITGNGDVLEPKEVFPGCGIMGVGSGGAYALGEWVGELRQRLSGFLPCLPSVPLFNLLLNSLPSFLPCSRGIAPKKTKKCL